MGLRVEILKVLPIIAVAGFFGLTVVHAGTTGKIAGVVEDAQTGDLLASASIVVLDTNMGTVSDPEGRFFILNVAPGTYTLRVTYIGYSPFTIENVRVSTDLTTDLKFELTSKAIQAEEVVIRAERPIIDKNATNAVHIIQGEDLEMMPFRGVQNLIALQAGVVEDEGRLHIRGSRSDEIAYYVEGASVRNVITGNSAVVLIDEAIEEIQLQSGGFNAEYGGANAGIILQELRTGGNHWKVTLSSETDNFASKGEKFLDTYSYGRSNSVLTLNGPLTSNIRAFISSQRRVRDSQATFWDGFEFTDLTDSGDRGGRVHWADSGPDTVDLELDGGNIPHTGFEAIDVNATLLFDLKPVKVQVTHLYSTADQEYNVAPVENMLNPDRLAEAAQTSRLTNIKATHLVNPSLFYEVNFSFYNQDREVADPNFGDHWWVYNDSVAVMRANPSFTPYTSQGIDPRPYDLNGFPFHRPGNGTGYYLKEGDQYQGISGSVTKQRKAHEIKAGFDYQRWTSRRYVIGLSSIRKAIASTYPNLDKVYDRYYAEEISEGQILDEIIRAAEAAPDGQGDLDDLKALIRNTSRADFYGYDEFGREADAPGIDGPRHPVLASVYVQDKIEYGDLIVNAGVRYDYFDVDSWRFVDPAAPIRDDTKFTIDAASLRETRTFTEISPRLGFSFPVSERTVFHVQYGRFSQMPSMRDMFTGGTRLALELGGQNFIARPAAYDIEPIRTTQYEIGFERQYSDFASFDLTGFYRDVEGQIQVARQKLSASAVNANAYNFLQNGDFATTKGLELVFKLRRRNRLRSELNYTLSDARGTGSSVNTRVASIEHGSNIPTVISPLDFNQTHRGSLYLDYRFAENDGGPILEQLGANLLMRFNSGHNFTFVDGSIGQRDASEGGILASDDPRSRKPVESINRSTTPWQFQVDLKIDKGFDLFGVEAVAYSYVRNLFNRKNVINVYGRTGNAEDDGFLTNPDLSSEIVAASGGLKYTQLYEAINLANRQHYWGSEGGDIYDEPRQIRIGLKLGI
jgi:hypothetical protein